MPSDFLLRLYSAYSERAILYLQWRWYIVWLFTVHKEIKSQVHAVWQAASASVSDCLNLISAWLVSGLCLHWIGFFSTYSHFSKNPPNLALNYGVWGRWHSRSYLIRILSYWFLWTEDMVYNQSLAALTTILIQLGFLQDRKLVQKNSESLLSWQIASLYNLTVLWYEQTKGYTSRALDRCTLNSPIPIILKIS